MWTRLRRRHFDSRSLVWQFAAATVLPALLVAAGLHWGIEAAPGLTLAVLLTAGLSAAVSAALAHRVGQALRQLGTATQVLRRSTPLDDMNLPLQTASAELQRASAGLRRLVELWRRRQRELILQTEVLGRRLELRTHELATLQDLSIGLASKTELHELVHEALAALQQTMAYTSASVWSRTARDEGGQVVLMGYRQHEDDDRPAPVEDLTGMRLSRANLQHYEHIERQGESIVENRVRQSLLSWLWSWLSDDARTSGLYRSTKAWMAVPLKSREAVMGVLRVDHEEADFFDAERIRLLTAVGSQTGLAMRHAQLLAQQKEQAVVAERNRIARDLHDAVSQTLFAANVIAGTLGRLAVRLQDGMDATAAAALQQQAAALERLNKGALSEMRLLMYELRPDALQHLPLAELLQHAIDALASRGTIEVSHRLAREDRLPSTTRVQLYRIAQEALSNIARHSGASHAIVEWTVPEQGHGGRLRIADDGHGFDITVSPPGHFGLRNMTERAAEIGATWQLTSGPDEGTDIRLELT